MSTVYREGSPPVGGFELPRARFGHLAILVVLLMAAIPAALGVAQQISFAIVASPSATGGNNAAATAYATGNQPPNLALADGANVRFSAKGDLVVLCSGISGASVNAQRNCPSLDTTIQR